ncbi:MAG: SUMF1/EgtB/PvdO family nonheme iron enzyme [Phycisphaerales bacterium]|nr:SUMF1/EgtB/PvdO family nonheme iron enzyme [Phycisphaerales bacterium]
MNRLVRTTLITTALCPAAALAQFDFNDPDRWSLVTSRDNIPFGGGPGGELAGRGSVPYDFRISRYEITTDDWLDFANTFATMSDELDELVVGSIRWGARVDFSYQGPGNRYVYNTQLEFPGRAPIKVTWRQVAMYCNWLHNGKSSDPATIHYGAYDTTTFGRTDDDFGYTDQSTRSCDARFWIPSLDEYLKAAHYDPDKNGQGPGWWAYGHSSDDPPMQGLPGVGHTVMGMSSDDIGQSVLFYPLGAFEDVISPWGLFDLIGGNPEWTEEWDLLFGNNFARMVKDSGNIFAFDPEGTDFITKFAPIFPNGSTASTHICRLASDSRADLDLDGRLTFFDVSEFITRYIAGSLSVDLDCDGVLTPSDIQRFIDLYTS